MYIWSLIICVYYIYEYVNGKTGWSLLVHHGQSAMPVNAKINEGYFVKGVRKIQEISVDDLISTYRLPTTSVLASSSINLITVMQVLCVTVCGT